MQHRCAAIVTRPVSEIVLMKSREISGVSRRACELPTAKDFSLRAITGPILYPAACAAPETGTPDPCLNRVKHVGTAPFAAIFESSESSQARRNFDRTAGSRGGETAGCERRA